MGRVFSDRGTGLGCICAYAREADDGGISALNWGYGNGCSSLLLYIRTFRY